MHRHALSLATLVVAFAAPAAAQSGPGPLRSAPITNVSYQLTFDRATAARNTVGVTMQFDVASNREVVLSLPAWTPGAYELSFFARKVSNFRAASAQGSALQWDKADFDTWRLRPAGPGTVTVSFDFRADSLDNAMAWSAPDFLMVNGTNVFLWAEGLSLDFPATLTVNTEGDWLVATGMRSAGTPRTYREENYHDLVDMPIFVGRMDLDSVQADGRWLRLASWPAGGLAGPGRQLLWEHIQAVIPPMTQVFGETPFESYTTLLIFSDSYGGGSALEHQNSHVGIYNPQFIGTGLLTNITAHEIFHAWNVKRLRPAELVPYRYDVAQPTPLLWVSEGFTNYYADVAMARAGLVDAPVFGQLVLGHIQAYDGVPPFALEDVSLETWIQPVDGTAYMYYEKGSVAGLLLDIMIRDATENRASLDDVLRTLYQSTFRRGRGFSTDEFFAQVQRTAGRSFDDFRRRYVDGRDEYPLEAVLPLAGYRRVVNTTRAPRLGIQTVDDSTGSRIVSLVPGGVMEAAGAQVGDVVLRLGDIAIANTESYGAYRERYGSREGEAIAIVVRREGRQVALQGVVRLAATEQVSIEVDPAASPRALAIRDGILNGPSPRTGGGR